jgi:hypothetical protein
MLVHVQQYDSDLFRTVQKKVLSLIWTIKYDIYASKIIQFNLYTKEVLNVIIFALYICYIVLTKLIIKVFFGSV